MLKFFGRLTLFATPILLGLGASFLLTLYIGDTLPLQVAVRTQRAHDGLLDVADEQVYEYRIQAVNTIKPDIIIIGTSRAISWRSSFFHKDTARFYNATVPGLQPDKLYDLVTSLDHLPTTIIYEVNIGHYGPGYRDREGNPAERIALTSYLLDNYQDSLQNLFLSRASLSYVTRTHDPVTNRNAYGTRARQVGNGFRADGSRQFGWTIGNPRQLELSFQHLYDLDFVGQQRMFAPGSYVDEGHLRATADILHYLLDNNVTVVGFASPFAPSVYPALINGETTYYLLALAEIETLFADYGVPFLDLTNPALSAIPDAEMRDIWHPTELSSARIYQQLVEAFPAIFEPWTELEHLEAFIAYNRAQNNLMNLHPLPDSDQSLTTTP